LRIAPEPGHPEICQLLSEVEQLLKVTNVMMAAGHARDDQDSAPPPLFLDRLEGLAEELARLGLSTRLMTPAGRVPSLHVVNPAASRLAEDVYVGRSQDGLCWFWWPWAERIAPGDDMVAAATLIARVLSARDQPAVDHASTD
jgi:hypothetical protein